MLADAKRVRDLERERDGGRMREIIGNVRRRRRHLVGNYFNE